MRSSDNLSPELGDTDDWLNDWTDQKPVSEVAFSFSGHEQNHLFLSHQGREFLDISALSGLDSDRDGRAFALLDFNRDGWQDVAVVNANEPFCELYRNEIGDRPELRREGNLIALRFVGGNHAAEPSTEFSNRDGFGLLATVELSDKTLIREHRCGEGFAAQNSTTMIVGIGTAERAESVRVRWPSGRTQHVDGVSSGTLLTFVERDSPEAPVRQEPYVLPARDDPKQPTADVPGQFALPLPDAESPKSRLVMYTTMATWCANCRRELPEIRWLRDQFSEAGLLIVGVPVDDEDDFEKLSRYQAELDPAYELLIDLSPEDRAAVRQFVLQKLQRDALPTTILTTSNGTLLAAMPGLPTISDIRRVTARAENSVR